MFWLVITTFNWALSFNLAGQYLAGQVDGVFSALMRVFFASLLFLPFLRRAGQKLSVLLGYLLVGACQLGIMYLFYFQAFRYLNVAEVLLFTVVTPVYITLFYDLLGRQAIRWHYLLTASLAVVGAAIIRYQQVGTNFWLGFCYIQAANSCFALGQVAYKRLMERHPMPQHSAFAWFYLGALLVTSLAWCWWGNPQQLPSSGWQWAVLLWLGVVASGLGYFMWNYGATQVDAGTLGIMNNMHIPTGLLLNVLFWQAKLAWGSFILGAVLILMALVWQYYGVKQLRDRSLIE